MSCNVAGSGHGQINQIRHYSFTILKEEEKTKNLKISLGAHFESVLADIWQNDGITLDWTCHGASTIF